MENPCDICMLKINCTAICFDKKNYKTLILNAITQCRQVSVTRAYFKSYMRYRNMLKETNKEEKNIIHRNFQYKSDN